MGNEVDGCGVGEAVVVWKVEVEEVDIEGGVWRDVRQYH